ncbi:MAG: right-handed parallel beta-helix repeat-containing protein, partial [Streptosporangiaceae bacterium]|nr:right-handed parallel beta-helix repeat-containing protein [Streptosporangiaceae bacterium]
MTSNRLVRLAGAVAAPLLVTGAVIAQAGVASANVGWHGDHDVLYVSKSASPSNDDRGCDSAAFSTIQSAVSAAPARGTVVVCGGTYHEQVVISKRLSLEGKRGATIDETGVTPAFQVTLPGLGTQTIFAAVIIVSSHVELEGFRVTNAQGEGVLAAGLGGGLRDIEIEHNAVVHNDLGGGVPPASPYFECAAAGQIPGDCGEGVHFVAVADSRVQGNFIARNSGGVLLTDETGPTHDNVIEGNVVTDNASDCGVTVPGHNPNALSAAGQRQPSVAGVYDNLIKENVITHNGFRGEGAGVLFANAGPGTASYDNRVEGNFIAGNELSGVTMHAHTIGPNQF